MNKIMGIDYGDKKVGIALTDLLNIMAFPYKTIRYDDESKLINQIKEIIKIESVNEVIVGLPKNMDGSQGFQAKKAIEFAEKLTNKLNIPVKLFDERLSTKKSLNDLKHMKLKTIKDKNILDSLSASNILESYLMKS